jgi:hypothetical protein
VIGSSPVRANIAKWLPAARPSPARQKLQPCTRYPARYPDASISVAVQGARGCTASASWAAPLNRCGALWWWCLDRPNDAQCICSCIGRLQDERRTAAWACTRQAGGQAGVCSETRQYNTITPCHAMPCHGTAGGEADRVRAEARGPQDTCAAWNAAMLRCCNAASLLVGQGQIR